MIEKYVVSLDLAKKLKEAGFPQDGGGWYWIKEEPGAKWELKYFDKICECPHICPSVDPDEYKGDCEFNRECTKWVSKDFWKCEYLHLIRAPLAEEILEELPISIFIKVEFPAIAIENYAEGRYYYLQIEPYESCYKVGYYWEDKLYAESDWLISLKDEKLSNALARLRLWLKENGYLEEKNEAGKNL